MYVCVYAAMQNALWVVVCVQDVQDVHFSGGVRSMQIFMSIFLLQLFILIPCRARGCAEGYAGQVISKGELYELSRAAQKSCLVN